MNTPNQNSACLSLTLEEFLDSTRPCFVLGFATLANFRSYTVKIESNRTKLRLIGQINGWVFGARAYFTCLRSKCL
jgi:hypothetical protein